MRPPAEARPVHRSESQGLSYETTFGRTPLPGVVLRAPVLQNSALSALRDPTAPSPCLTLACGLGKWLSLSEGTQVVCKKRNVLPVLITTTGGTYLTDLNSRVKRTMPNPTRRTRGLRKHALGYRTHLFHQRAGTHLITPTAPTAEDAVTHLQGRLGRNHREPTLPTMT